MEQKTVVEQRKEILISDMGTCLPASSISDDWGEGLWHRVPYELVDGTEGVMLFAEPEDHASEIVLKPNATGRYKIFVGMNYGFCVYQNGHTNRLVEWDYGALFLKLSSDKGFTRVACEKYDQHAVGKYRVKFQPEKSGKKSFNTIYETYWKTAELTGEDLVFCPPGEPYDNKYYGQLANISYVRLVPAEEEDLQLEETLKPTAETKNMAALWCTGALSGHTSGQTMYHPTDKAWFENEFEPFRNSDFGIFCFEAMRGNLCLFKTKTGDVGTKDKSWPEEWLDPLEEFTKLAHAEGMKAFAGLRMMGGSRHYSRYPINWARFFWDHQEWAKRDKEGRPCGNSSLAFKEVREHWCTLISEALDYGLDGIQLHLNRSHPFVMYEEPVVQDFIKASGIDPRTLSEEDPRWMKHCASYTTQFLREIRAILDQKPGRELSVLVTGYEDFEPGTVCEECDIEAWLDEGLINYLFADHHVNPSYIKYWKEYSKNTVPVYYSIMPRTMPGEDYAARAEELYDLGADGLCVWDCERRVQRISEWNVVKHLGHKKHLRLIKEAAPSYFKLNPLKTHKGLNVKYSYRDG